MGDHYEQIIREWILKGIESSHDLEEALAGQEILLAYNSGKIENQYITYWDTKDIFETGKIQGYTGDTQTIIEIKNAKDAHEFILQSFDKKEKITEEWLKELHYEFTKGAYDASRIAKGEKPGHYKIGFYVTGQSEVGAAPEDVKEEMDELLHEIQEASPRSAKDALTVAAYFHCKFENIHPFADGNGRTGRMAMNYYLLTHNHPPVIFEAEQRENYYNALDAWNEKQDLKPMKTVMEKSLEKTWRKALRFDREEPLRDEIRLDRYLDLGIDR